MKNITNKVNGDFYPEFLIAGYKHEDKFYLEHCPINRNTGEVLAGKPLGHDTVDEMLTKLAYQKKSETSKEPFGKVPEGLLYVDTTNGNYVWTIKAGKRNLYFESALGIPDGEAEIPNLVFVVRAKSLKVFALKKIDPDAKLCHAPFHNVNTMGAVCQGSAKANMKSNSLQSVLEYWETIFFSSIFTSIHNTEVVKGNLNLIWKDLITTGKKFNNSLLVETTKTLESLLK